MGVETTHTIARNKKAGKFDGEVEPAGWSFAEGQGLAGGRNLTSRSTTPAAPWWAGGSAATHPPPASSLGAAVGLDGGREGSGLGSSPHGPR